MDHSSVTVTEKHYATLLESQLADDIEKLDDL